MKANVLETSFECYSQTRFFLLIATCTLAISLLIIDSCETNEGFLAIFQQSFDRFCVAWKTPFLDDGSEFSIFRKDVDSLSSCTKPL